MIGIDPTLGYWIAKEHWGQGYVREAAHAVLSAISMTALPFRYSSYFVKTTLCAVLHVWASHP